MKKKNPSRWGRAFVKSQFRRRLRKLLHSDRSPSFTADVIAGVWKCWPCNLGGTVIDPHADKVGISREGSQRRIILDALIHARGSWVRLDHLIRIAHAGAAHSAVDGLRKLDWHIVSQMTLAKRDGQRVTHSEYRIPEDSLPDISNE